MNQRKCGLLPNGIFLNPGLENRGAHPSGGCPQNSFRGRDRRSGYQPGFRIFLGRSCKGLQGNIPSSFPGRRDVCRRRIRFGRDQKNRSAEKMAARKKGWADDVRERMSDKTLATFRDELDLAGVPYEIKNGRDRVRDHDQEERQMRCPICGKCLLHCGGNRRQVRHVPESKWEKSSERHSDEYLIISPITIEDHADASFPSKREIPTDFHGRVQLGLPRLYIHRDR